MHGATAHAIGAALHEAFVYDDDGLLLTSQLPGLPRAFTRWRCPISRPATREPVTRSHRSERRASARAAAAGFTPSRPRSRTRSAGPDGGIVHESFNNTERIYRLIHEPERSRSLFAYRVRKSASEAPS